MVRGYIDNTGLSWFNEKNQKTDVIKWSSTVTGTERENDLTVTEMRKDGPVVTRRTSWYYMIQKETRLGGNQFTICE